MPKLNAKDLTAEQIAKLPKEVQATIKKAAQKQERHRKAMSKDDVRQYAFRVHSAMDGLSKSEKARVLKFALTLNDH